MIVVGRPTLASVHYDKCEKSRVKMRLTVPTLRSDFALKIPARDKPSLDG
jgi:hypothetical protein